MLIYKDQCLLNVFSIQLRESRNPMVWMFGKGVVIASPDRLTEVKQIESS